jgi:hypothetical protein
MQHRETVGRFVLGAVALWSSGCGSGLALLAVGAQSDDPEPSAPTQSLVVSPAPASGLYAPESIFTVAFSESIVVDGAPREVFRLEELELEAPNVVATRQLLAPLVSVNPPTELQAGQSASLVTLTPESPLRFDREYRIVFDATRIRSSSTGVQLGGNSALTVRQFVVADGAWDFYGVLDFSFSSGNPVMLPNKGVTTLFYPRGGFTGDVFSATLRPLGSFAPPRIIEATNQSVFRGPSSVHRASDDDWTVQTMWYNGRPFRLYQSDTGSAVEVAPLKLSRLATLDGVEGSWGVIPNGGGQPSPSVTPNAPSPTNRDRSWQPQIQYTGSGFGVATWLYWPEWTEDLVSFRNGDQGNCAVNNGLLSPAQVWAAVVRPDGTWDGSQRLSAANDGAFSKAPLLDGLAGGRALALWYQADTPDCWIPEDNNARIDCACEAGDTTVCPIGSAPNPNLPAPCSRNGNEDFYFAVYEQGVGWMPAAPLQADSGTPAKDLMFTNVMATRTDAADPVEDVAVLVGVTPNDCSSCGDCMLPAPLPDCQPTIQVFRPQAPYLSNPIALDLSMSGGGTVRFFRRKVSNWIDRYGERGLRVVHVEGETFFVFFAGWYEDPVVTVTDEWQQPQLFVAEFDATTESWTGLRALTSPGELFTDPVLWGSVPRVMSGFDSFQVVRDDDGNLLVLPEMVFSAVVGGTATAHAPGFVDLDNARKVIGALRYSSARRPSPPSSGWSSMTVLNPPQSQTTSYYASNPKISNSSREGEFFLAYRLYDETSNNQGEAIANAASRFRFISPP